MYNADTLSPGAHTLKVVAEDDLGNKTEQEISFILDTPPAAPGVFFQNTTTDLTPSDFPVSIFLRPFEAEKIKSVSIIGVAPDSSKNLLYRTKNITDLFDNSLVFIWKTMPAQGGTWRLNAEVELMDGTIHVSDQLNIVIKK
jgi:hypothetical protein